MYLIYTTVLCTQLITLEPQMHADGSKHTPVLNKGTSNAKMSCRAPATAPMCPAYPAFVHTLMTFVYELTAANGELHLKRKKRNMLATSASKLIFSFFLFFIGTCPCITNLIFFCFYLLY